MNSLPYCFVARNLTGAHFYNGHVSIIVTRFHPTVICATLERFARSAWLLRYPGYPSIHSGTTRFLCLCSKLQKGRNSTIVVKFPQHKEGDQI